MSAHRRQLVLTERAVSDVRSIQRYTLEQWGSDQTAEYEAAIHRVLETLRDQPNLGRNRDDLLTGLRSYPVLSHTIFYRVENHTLVVQRIVHQRVDIARLLMT